MEPKASQSHRPPPIEQKVGPRQRILLSPKSAYYTGMIRTMRRKSIVVASDVEASPEYEATEK